MLIVQKFGGSSLADHERMRRAAQIILDARSGGQQVLAVVSAAGDTTDELKSEARKLSKNPALRELDALLSTGEQQSAAYLAVLLKGLGVNALSLSGWQAGILTSGAHGNAEIIRIFPHKIEKALKEGQVVIVSGFQGVSPSWDITTLGRGGSDTTAVALAAALGADECRIYTDVPGICSADPRLVNNVKFWNRLDYRDMLALSRAGCQVLKSDSVKLAMDNKIKLRLLSSFEHSEGSELCFLNWQERPDFTGVTKDEEKSSISVVGKAVSDEVLFNLMNSLQNSGTEIYSGEIFENCISLKVAREQLSKALELSHRILFK